MMGFFLRSAIGSSRVQRALPAHFKGIALIDIVTGSREFPITSRVDIQTALEDVVMTFPTERIETEKRSN